MTESGSSRSRPKGTYDVFLSFRGKDTRKNFTDHLYTALVQAGIHTFRDDSELPRGEEIPKHLLKAIPESKILIVVFSKGYASSRWCLNELVEIIECKNRNTDQIVLPIFYDIDPSDFQTQKCNFAKAFDKHDDRFKEKAKEWRKALEEAKNLSGWNLNVMANGYGATMIMGATFGTSSWVRYERKYEMAIEEYCGEELELYLQLQMDELEIKEIGVHVIVEKPDSFEESEWEWECNNDIVNQRISSSVDVEEEDEIDSQESEWEWDHDIEKLQGTTSSGDVEERDEIDSQSGTDRVILKLYHRRLHHPLLGSIASSTREQWITYLLKMLPAEFVSFVIYLNRPLT
ncbi:unnamed protein product [Dovyalis caffra]|uniref:TIR domain-containing protein n=1 Tax=Dovyalis caffra TaxID=77055 RepID=A0AAV1SJT9_9ROSI|nr:unnamed protein product [Dovyalis caffra]